MTKKNFPSIRSSSNDRAGDFVLKQPNKSTSFDIHQKLNENEQRLKHLNLFNNNSNKNNNRINSDNCNTNLKNRNLKILGSSSSAIYDSNHKNNINNNPCTFFKSSNANLNSTNAEKENNKHLKLANMFNNEFKNNDVTKRQATEPACNSIKYGELIVLGYNGCITNMKTGNAMHDPCHSYHSSRRKSKFSIKRREKPNGVKPAFQFTCKSSQEVNNCLSNNINHSVTYTLSRNHTVVVQYERDEKTDMFQIGRSSEPSIDFIVLDTHVTSPNTSPESSLQVPNNPNNQLNNPQSTISRFSCRILVDREYPYTARIYAAGFDSSKSIFLGEKATKWKNEKGEIDGVTTNGVLIMHPTDSFIGEESSVGEWMEVSVCGAVFSLNESRLTPCLSTNANTTTKQASSTKSNILRDGTLIDLCGATLLWRSVESLQKTPTKHYIEMNLENLNRLRPQCPVGLKTLMFPSTASPQAHQQLVQTCVLSKLNNLSRLNRQLLDRIPMVYLKCGHVHGQHDWGVKNDNERECPLCRTVGSYVQLLIGLEPSLYTDINDTNNNSNLFKPYAFRPCGHMASEKTCKYWSRIQVPQGTMQGLSAICPFCAVPLCKEKPYVKLIFQEGVHF